MQKLEQIKNSSQITVQEKYKAKHSVSFVVSIALMVSMLLNYYLPVFTDTEGSAWKYVLILAAIFCCVLIFILFLVRNTKLNSKVLFFIALFFITAVISVFLNSSGIERMFGLLTVLLSIYAFQRDPLKEFERTPVFFAFIICTVLVLLNGVKGNAVLEVPDDKFNPNLCGLLVTLIFAVSVTRFIATHKKSNLLIALISFGLQFYYISRTALLGCLFFVFLIIVCRAWRTATFKKSTVFWTIFVFSMLGVLLAYLYSEVLFPAVGHGNIIILGKDLFTGRQIVWHFTFESIKKNFFFGVGNHLNDDLYAAGYNEWIKNAHNQYLGVLAGYGFFPFILFSFAFANLSAHSYGKNKKDSRTNRLPAIFLLTFIVMGWFEFYLLTQRCILAILIAFALIFGYSTKDKEKLKTTNN